MWTFIDTFCLDSTCCVMFTDIYRGIQKKKCLPFFELLNNQILQKDIYVELCSVDEEAQNEHIKSG